MLDIARQYVESQKELKDSATSWRKRSISPSCRIPKGIESLHRPACAAVLQSSVESQKELKEYISEDRDKVFNCRRIPKGIESLSPLLYRVASPLW